MSSRGEVGSGLGPGSEEGGVYAIVRRADIEIHLQIRRRAVFAGKREGIESDCYVFVSDAEALFEEFAAKGVAVHRAPENTTYGLCEFVLEDPEGHRLAFGTPLG